MDKKYTSVDTNRPLNDVNLDASNEDELYLVSSMVAQRPPSQSVKQPTKKRTSDIKSAEKYALGEKKLI